MKAVIFDYAGTIYNPFTKKLYPKALDVLNKLKERGLKLALASRAADPKKRGEDFERFHLDKYFDVLEIVPVQNSKEFTPLLNKLNVKPESCLIVGDRVKSEILEGNRIGCKTVWILQGEFLDESPENELEEPDYKINSLEELFSHNIIT